MTNLPTSKKILFFISFLNVNVVSCYFAFNDHLFHFVANLAWAIFFATVVNYFFLLRPANMFSDFILTAYMLSNMYRIYHAIDYGFFFFGSVLSIYLIAFTLSNFWKHHV